MFDPKQFGILIYNQNCNLNYFYSHLLSYILIFQRTLSSKQCSIFSNLHRFERMTFTKIFFNSIFRYKINLFQLIIEKKYPIYTYPLYNLILSIYKVVIFLKFSFLVAFTDCQKYSMEKTNYP